MTEHSADLSTCSESFVWYSDPGPHIDRDGFQYMFSGDLLLFYLFWGQYMFRQSTQRGGNSFAGLRQQFFKYKQYRSVLLLNKTKRCLGAASMLPKLCDTM